ncbi:uncharacterized protein G2W53_037989 [Senna tora]|uniref:Uncharacterized protein n=1 Tax=Senna tora TaxID=362788 RepID=A0A834SNB2_9FABA|nr:uncharacterized protein G2W53_037989 [Senna tora]
MSATATSLLTVGIWVRIPMG